MTLMHNSFASDNFQQLLQFREAVSRDVPNWEMTRMLELGVSDETWFDQWKEQLEKASGVFVIESDAYSQKVNRGPNSPLHKEAVAIIRRRNDDPTFKVFVFNPSKAGQGPNDLVVYLHRNVGDMNFVGWQKWLQRLQQRTHPKPAPSLRTALNICAKGLLTAGVIFLMRLMLMIRREGNVRRYCGKMMSWWGANFPAANYPVPALPAPALPVSALPAPAVLAPVLPTPVLDAKISVVRHLNFGNVTGEVFHSEVDAHQRFNEFNGGFHTILMIGPEGGVRRHYGTLAGGREEEMRSWWDVNLRAAKPLDDVSQALLYKSTVMGIFSETGTTRLDIGGQCMKKDCPANHESWGTRLVFKRLDGKSSGQVLSDHIFGIFTKDGDGAKRLDIGAGSLKQECPGSHNSWATRFTVRRLDVADEGPICYGHTVGIFSEAGRVRLDIGSQCVTKERPGNHDSPTTRLRAKVLPPEARL